MMEEMTTHAFACSIFKAEIEYLIEHGQVSGAFTYIDSDLHMRPQELQRVLSALIEPGCFFCYGTCHPRMREQQDRGIINRVDGLNCCEIFLGKSEYRRLRGEGAFFLLPEWTHKWEHIFKELLGFSDQALAAEFMNEMHKKFIYLNTGVSPIPHETLAEITRYFSLPLEILDIDLVHLRDALDEGIRLLKK